MKKVLVHGYFRDNLGDDLFFRVLARRYPHVMFYIPTTRWDYREKFADIKNIRIIDFLKIAKVTAHKVYLLPKLYSRLHMGRFDAVVCIGGSLFIDRRNPTPNDRVEAEKYSFICDWEYAQKAGVPYYVLGVNWGPCYNDYFYHYFDRAFDSLADLCFRDRASFETFSHKANARCAGDILMDHPMLRSRGESVPKKRQLAVSPVDPAGKSEAPCDAGCYYGAIASLCAEAAAQGYEVKLLSFCKDEGDERAVAEILSRTGNSGRITAVYYRHNWEELVRTLAESELIVSSRFHGTVIGWTVGVPVYSVTYSQKTVSLIRDCGFHSGFTKIENLGELAFETVRQEAILPQNRERFSGARRAFEKLDGLLKEEEQYEHSAGAE